MLTLTFQYSIDTIAFRSFSSGFLSSIKGDKLKIHLPENCLGENQKEEILQFLENIKNEQPLIALDLSHKFLTDIETNCPIEDVEQIIIDVETFLSKENHKIFERIYSRSKNLLSLFGDYEMDIQRINSEKESAELIGKYLGKAFNIIFYVNDNTRDILKFLDTDDLNKSDSEKLANSNKTFYTKPMELFVDGFFEGVSSVPFEDNHCYTDISLVKSQIVETFQDVINAIKNQTGVIEAFQKIYALITKLKDLDGDCRFEALSLDILALRTKVGLGKLIYRLSTHLVPVMADLHNLYADYKIKEFRGCGEAFGLFIKTALNYSTI